MKLRTIAKANEYEIYQDLNGQVFLNGRQFDSAIDAARSVRDYPEICAELIKQVLEVQDSYIDGLDTFEELKRNLEDEPIIKNALPLTYMRDHSESGELDEI